MAVADPGAEVARGDAETGSELVVLAECVEACGGFFDEGSVAVEQEVGIGLMVRAPDPPAKLMQLGEAKSFSVFDNHDRCVGRVHPDLDHCRGHKDIDLACAETCRGGLFFFGFHTPVQQADTIISESRAEVAPSILRG